MSKILITGGGGFIGTSTANLLSSIGHDVELLDLDKKFNSDHADYIKHSIDITNFSNFKVLNGKKFDFIFHLAAQTSGAISQEEPEKDADINVKGILNVCNFARACNAQKIIFSSSMAVYGNKIGKINENDSALPVSNYGASKLSGEIFLKMFKQFGIDYSIFRLFNVYGPGQDFKNLRQGMASIYMAQSITGKQIKVTGSFDRYRDFVYISDVSNALALGLDSRTDSMTLNVGSGIKTTVKELIDIILNTHDEEKISFSVINAGGHEGDQFGSLSDISKISDLGWSPKISLEKGISLMYNRAKKEFSL
jgi:UDP-glucose 4-epimerase